MKYKLAIFDMDGTILDTLEDLTDSINYATAKNGFPMHTIDEVRGFVGNGLLVLVDKACPNGASEADKKKVFDDFKEYYALHSADKTKAYDGICKLLENLKKAGCLTAVVSNKPHSAVCALCDKYFENLFDAALGEMPEIPRKPSAEPVNHILNKLGIDKCDAVYIGDSDVDLKTAQNSGLNHIIVTWGFRSEELLRSLGATTFAHTPEDVYDIIYSASSNLV